MALLSISEVCVSTAASALPQLGDRQSRVLAVVPDTAALLLRAYGAQQHCQEGRAERVLLVRP